MKFLIDECLSPELVDLARARGYGESSHVTWMGRGGAKDWQLLPLIVDGDWTFVTQNSYDFRGPANRPGSRGEYARTDIHAGLVCLNGPAEGMDLDLHRGLFEVALDELQAAPDLVNQVLEVSLVDIDGDFEVVRYALPAS